MIFRGLFSVFKISLFSIHTIHSLEIFETFVCILKAHSHSKSGGSIWASLECQCCFWIAGGLVSYLTMWLLILQLLKNSIDTQGKLRLNLHSLSVSVSELSEYRRLARFSLYRIAFRCGAKKHLSDTECTTFRSWAKQHLSVAIIPLKIEFLKGMDGCFSRHYRKL
jgi:hypothetical protein